MISRETIDKIFETARIEEVIADFVQLKKSGSNLKGLSPFSNEKTPSFMVSPAKQIFKDFSSGKGGTVVTFLMEHEHYTYPEALRFLAKKYNIEVEEDQQTDEDRAKRNERESLFLVNEFANQFYQDQLWKSEAGRQIGLSYFKERGFSEDTIKQFQLGYSPEAYEALSQAAEAENYQLTYLEKTGLVKVDGQRKVDRFRGRVMFPILSHTGRVLGFGGRTLKKDAKIAKYLNSPESDIYHKSKILYGIYQAKQSLGREDECFLVEGYTDVISLYQAGVHNVVASSGTALTVDQINLVKRFTQNITLLYDGDAAGLKASLRGIDLILAQGMNVSVVLFPEGEDPDSYAQSVSEVELKSYLAEEQQNFLRFKARLLLEDSGDDPLARSKAAQEMVKSIALIPNVLERNAYVQETSNILGIEERILFSELGQVKRKLDEEEQRAAKRAAAREERQQGMAVVGKEESEKPVSSPLHKQERDLCWLMLNYGEKEYSFLSEHDEPDSTPEKESVAEYILTEITADELSFEHPLYQKLFSAFQETYQEEESIAKAEDFLKRGDKDLMHLVVDLISEDEPLHDWSKKKIYPPTGDYFVQRFTTESVLRYKEKKISQLIQNIQGKLKNQAEEENQNSLEMLVRLNKLRVKIDQTLNRVV